MNQSQFQNLLKLQEIVRRVPEVNVDMGQFLIHGEGVQPDQAKGALEEEGCGTVFCMLGAAALSGQFEGLSYSRWNLTYKDDILTWLGLSGLCYTEASAELFGLDEVQANDLFKPVTWQETGMPEKELPPGEDKNGDADRYYFDRHYEHVGLATRCADFDLKSDKTVALERLSKLIEEVASEVRDEA